MRYKTVQLPEQMVQQIKRVIGEFKKLGYVSIKGFVEDSVRRRLEEIESRRHSEPVA
ncbi:MAG: hypothetical protein U9O89_02885 [Thermoproteota archaeon]|nr:hypothetical protein [Thermoproteota archaeon]